MRSSGRTVSEVDPDGETRPQELAVSRATSAEQASPPLVAERYEILGMLGSGGMGTVYRARDRELDEVVALKLLKAELAASPSMIERFRREVKLARRVTHPNVVRTFDIGDHDGDRFLTMELVEGEMLGSHLAKHKRLSVRTVVRIGADVCAGLAAAHAAGVLHRDLKPENVIRTRDGRSVITDFGIARAFAAGSAGRTLGGLVGTPAYMAPEQVEGIADLDGRADLYALGTMMFELLSGTLPWTGDSVVAIAAARLLRPPPDVREVSRASGVDVPEAVASLVSRLMARSRDDRFATADEARLSILALEGTDLSDSTPAPRAEPFFGAVSISSRPHGRPKRVAVLPLENLGANDDEYLAETLTEDLVDLLSVVPELRVRPRGETSRARDASRSVRERGRELGVDVVVDGSLRRIEGALRVALRLVTVEDGFQLWARRFDATAANVLTVADEAATAIAQALQTERTAEPRGVAKNPEAQERYLRGRHLVHSGWFDAARDGVDLLREAHGLAPDDPKIAGTYALAVARVMTGGSDYAVVSRAARELAERTLERTPDQPEARIALGTIHLNDAEGAAAARELNKAISFAPGSAEALDAIGRMLVEMGRAELGIATLRRAISIDPSLEQARQAIARTHALLGEFETADEVLGPMPRRPQDLVPYLLMKGRFALWRRDATTSAELEEAVERVGLSPLASERLSGLLYVVKTGTLPPEARAAMEGALPMHASSSPRRCAFHGQIRAEVKLGAGDRDGALADLRQADSNGLLDLLWLDRCPLFEPIRDAGEFEMIRESTAARVERVARALEP